MLGAAVSSLVENLIFPPALLLYILLFRVVSGKLCQRLLGVGMLYLYVASIPLGGYWISAPLIRSHPFWFACTMPDPDWKSHTAVVVLSAGQQPVTPSGMPQLALSASTTNRLMYAVHLAQAHHLPIWLSGNGPWPTAVPEATSMAYALATHPGSLQHYTENASRNTEENARMVLEKIRQKTPHIRTILLVTDSWHMPRAYFWFRVFSSNTESIVPAPLPAQQAPLWSNWRTWLMHPTSLTHSQRALREYAAWLGIAGRYLIGAIPG